jgi:hypothetical protein
MKDQEWYIAGADDGDPYTIILYDPVSQEKATTISNGVYLKENSRHKVYTHDGATGHAWLWVQHNNGTWYWIDPTWTDNTGYVWWGMVENGKEVQYYPDPVYCVASNYPRPGATGTGTRSRDSTYIEDPNAATSLAQFAWIVGYSSPLDGFGGLEKCGFSFSFEDPFLSGLTFHSFSIDLFRDAYGGKPYYEDKIYWSTYDAFSLIFGVAMGYPIFRWLVVFAGGGLGFTGYGESSGSSSDPQAGVSYSNSKNDSIDFAWKVNGGLRLKLSDFFIKAEVSYGTIIGPAFGIGVGLVF